MTPVRIILPFVVFCTALTSLAVPAFAESVSPAIYEVRKGDFLGLIGHKYGVSIGELRDDNKLSSDVLQIGQKIRINKPFRLLKKEKVDWSNPCKNTGEVLHPFGPYKKKGVIMPRTGTDLRCSVGTAVSAPAIGVVRYVGFMDGFGTLIILEHGGDHASVFAPFDPGSVAVVAGQAVLPGDHLGRTGPPPEKDTPAYLHVELRKNDKAIKPDPLLK